MSTRTSFRPRPIDVNKGMEIMVCCCFVVVVVFVVFVDVDVDVVGFVVAFVRVAGYCSLLVFDHLTNSRLGTLLKRMNLI